MQNHLLLEALGVPTPGASPFQGQPCGEVEKPCGRAKVSAPGHQYLRNGSCPVLYPGTELAPQGRVTTFGPQPLSLRNFGRPSGVRLPRQERREPLLLARLRMQQHVGAADHQ